MHALLMIRAVVVHNIEHRDPMMGRRPKRTWYKQEVAVAADGDGQPPIFLVCECSTKRSRQGISDAPSARNAVPPVRLIEIPKEVRPAEPDRCANERPVLVLDLR